MTDEAHNQQDAEARETEPRTNSTRSHQPDDGESNEENAIIDDSDGELGQRPPGENLPGEQPQANTEDEPSPDESAGAPGSSQAADPNQKELSDLASTDIDLHGLLSEEIPSQDADVSQREMFIKRQYEAERITGGLNAVFRRRMGIVLIGLQKQKKHGEWEDYVRATYPFSSRTAYTYMRIARETTEEEALQHGMHDLMLKLGLTQGSEPPETDPLDTAVAKLKSIWRDVMQLSRHNGSLLVALRRAKGADPAFDALTALIRETKISLDSLSADIHTRQQIAAKWDARRELPNHDGDAL